uniref:Complex I-ESSS n=1 Tax=Fibrocapsa japonica TaxID=94617 RepID=A0A7S2UXN8_9STRA|mmetsp:Transcript_19143/g.27648  ORF Transcript_19143/g.27648 Transcript_19143/m.27648 type:complete len:141 (+) Transcript_19143:61-483(+)|eukprot:CAMPEP_0113934294 /NCGR_PEP_ID=MMETSP1339-20121228/1633_1 /TAXON_ID=94617 /ORGANISM="Fibrocapsa japonica" /LENGTH=140 /DNA_ID=CAMNT_0000936027 /DNA_START=60 /DNA_END=482 /DNA_ORIENTATION=- /assembly_acc=CAM_ASM_000762
MNCLARSLAKPLPQTKGLISVLSRRGLAGGPPPYRGTQFENHFLQRVPGLTYEREGWEIGYGLCAIASTILVVGGLWNKPNTDIETWARHEAIARLKAKEAGEEIVYGKIYQNRPDPSVVGNLETSGLTKKGPQEGEGEE